MLVGNSDPVVSLVSRWTGELDGDAAKVAVGQCESAGPRAERMPRRGPAYREVRARIVYHLNTHVIGDRVGREIRCAIGRVDDVQIRGHVEQQATQ